MMAGDIKANDRAIKQEGVRGRKEEKKKERRGNEGIFIGALSSCIRDGGNRSGGGERGMEGIGVEEERGGQEGTGEERSGSHCKKCKSTLHINAHQRLQSLFPQTTHGFK